MVPETAAEVLHFLTRRDLDKACCASKWLDVLIAQCCKAYPLRPVRRVVLLPSENDFTPGVVIDEEGHPATDHQFDSVNEAVHFACATLRNSYVENLEVTLSAFMQIPRKD
jgi:hypothetical protein